MSSISQTDGIYWQNQKELPDYYSEIDQGRHPIAKGYLLTEDDRLRRVTIMRLMCDLSLDFAAMSESLEIDFAQYFAPELASLDDLEADYLIERTPRGFVVTDVGRLLIRNIAMRFDAYLTSDKERRFSKTI
jgi:oxygen-independent coproporphyrinogen-3 oxidase